MLSNREIFLRHLGLPSIPAETIEMVRASGIYQYDEQGNDYIDLVSGVSVSNVGHAHPKVLEAVCRQAQTYMHLMVYGKFVQSPQVKLAATITQNLPDALDAVYFVNSGSEAIEGALKLAKRITARSELVYFENAYHGGTAGALSLLGNETMKNAFRPLLPDTRMLRFNDFDALEQISSRTAAVLVEPIQAEAGIILPEPNWLKALRKRCDETGSLLIFDEIQMGFGRTGKLFAFEHEGLIPDILCLAKGMGGGMPIGAFVSSKANMLALTQQPELGHITTFGGHPVCCAAALASLEVILNEKLFEKADKKGKVFVERLKSHPAIKQIRQKGLMLGVEIHRQAKMPELMKAFTVNKLIVDRFLFNDASFRIAPPLTITDDEIAKSLLRIEQSLSAIEG